VTIRGSPASIMRGRRSIAESRSRSSSAAQSSALSLLVQMTPSLPPSRSTLAISGTASAGSNQCHAVETTLPNEPAVSPIVSTRSSFRATGAAAHARCPRARRVTIGDHRHNDGTADLRAAEAGLISGVRYGRVWPAGTGVAAVQPV
jgi:hypothetical protein